MYNFCIKDRGKKLKTKNNWLVRLKNLSVLKKIKNIRFLLMHKDYMYILDAASMNNKHDDRTG